MKTWHFSRREFIRKSSLAMAALSAGTLGTSYGSIDKLLQGNSGMPMRMLGNTGEKISILGYGGGSQFMLMPDGEWEPHLKYALDAGINYFDTASSYGAGSPKTSEERYGEILPSYRKKIILLTKLDNRDPEKAKAEFETSLKRLRTDYVDIILIHAVNNDDSLSSIESGMYKFLRGLKQQKTARFIGFSSMDSAERSKELIDNFDFDVALLAINPTNYKNFAEVALPSARKKNMGIMAIKVMRNLVNQYAKPKELLEYIWNLNGVSCALVSQTGMDPLKQNIEIARQYSGFRMGLIERKKLETRLAGLGGPHVLEWARTGYRDGDYI